MPNFSFVTTVLILVSAITGIWALVILAYRARNFRPPCYPIDKRTSRKGSA